MCKKLKGESIVKKKILSFLLSIFLLIPAIMFVGCGKNPPEEFDSKETFYKEINYIYSESETILENSFNSGAGNVYARIAYQLRDGYNDSSYEMYRNNDSGTIVFDSDNKEFLTQRGVDGDPSPKEISEETLNEIIEGIFSCKFAYYYDSIISLEEIKFEKNQKDWAGKDKIYFYKTNKDVLTDNVFGTYSISTKTFSFIGDVEVSSLIIEFGTYIVENGYITDTALEDLHDFSKDIKSLIITNNRELSEIQVLENRELDNIIFETGHYIFETYNDSFNIQNSENWIKAIKDCTNVIFVKNNVVIKENSVVHKHFVEIPSDKDGFLKFLKI